jgi:hypothetical protein
MIVLPVLRSVALRNPISILLALPPKDLSPREIIKWWECRRPIYNLLLIGYIWWFAGSLAPGAAQSYHAPPDMAFDVILAALSLFCVGLANLWYTGGWMTEMFVVKVLRLRFRVIAPLLYLSGIAASIYVVISTYVLFLLAGGWFILYGELERR